MAPKRLLQDPPTAAAAASSVDEDSDDETLDEDEEEVQNQNDVVEDENEESGDEEEEDDDDDDDNEEEENVDAKKPNVPNPKSESASSDDDAGSETESDDMNHSPSASDFTVKPIISKPTAAAAPAKKRAAEESDSNPKESKKKKAGNGGGDDEDTKRGQGRLWGEDDEIAILEGMIEFKAKRGTDPSSNMGAFHEFLKKSLKVDVSKNQLMDKARRLKKKYRTNAEKGEDLVFSRAHEMKSFELSRRIWGVEANGGDDGAKKNVEKKPRKSAEADSNNNKPTTVLALLASDSVRNNVENKVEANVANGVVKAEPEEFWTKYPNLSESLRVGSCSSKWEGLERVVSQSMPSIGSSKAKGLDDMWRKLQVSEMELAVKKLDLIHEQAKLALEVMKSRQD